MIKEIPIRLKTIETHYQGLSDGYFLVHVQGILNEAEAIARACRQHLGHDESHALRLHISKPPIPSKSKFSCQFCNLEFETERGVLAHESVKHRELWKQAK